MPIALHMTFKGLGGQGSAHADDLQRCNKRGKGAWEHRVVELDVEGKRLGRVDLSSTRASLAELETALHSAQEVHLHGHDVASMLREIPYVKPEALANTPLYVHGPCCKNEIKDPESKITHLEAWPGPISYDLAASLSLELTNEGEVLGADLLPLDPWSALLTPRQGPTGPIEGLAEDEAVIVCLSRMLEDQQRTEICERVEKLFCACPASVDVGWIDESKLHVLDARKHRRLAQLFVTSSWGDPGCLEAMAACTPFWVLDGFQSSTLAPWLAQLGVDPNAHRLSPLEDKVSFGREWQAAIDLWARGESLAAKSEYRDAIIKRCLNCHTVD